MIAFQDMKVVSFSREYFDIYWEIEPTTDDLQEWQFFVERSEAEASGFEAVAGPLVDQFYLRDNSVHTRNEIRTWFYRVRALHPREGYEILSPVADIGGPADLLAEEVTRVQTVVWREYAGTAFWVFPRRTFGQRCPACFDEVLGKVSEANCEVCWGTGFSGGHHRPVKTWGQVQPTAIKEEVSVEDHRQPEAGQITCPPSPTIRPGDLVVTANNGRFLVTVQDSSQRLGVDVRQTITMHKVEPGAVEDKIPLNVDSAVEEVRGPRNFTNPHNLEDAHDVDMGSYGELLGVYSG